MTRSISGCCIRFGFRGRKVQGPGAIFVLCREPSVVPGLDFSMRVYTGVLSQRFEGKAKRERKRGRDDDQPLISNVDIHTVFLDQMTGIRSRREKSTGSQGWPLGGAELVMAIQSGCCTSGFGVGRRGGVVVGRRDGSGVSSYGRSGFGFRRLGWKPRTDGSLDIFLEADTV